MKRATAACLTWLIILPLSGCGESERIPLLEPAQALRQIGPAAPSPLMPLSFEETIEVWPFTGTSFASAPQDPINLVFTGIADPRNVRNALMSLDGTRGGPFAGFDCVWKDAIGGQQTAYSEAGGWSGSVIQLECGDYAPFRFHIRLFGAGDWTLANAHVDILIRGTVDHQVLSWELGEQLVAYDLLRSGFAAAGGSTGKINPWPTFRSIPPVIYNSLPTQLKSMTGVVEQDVAAPVGIPNNGEATMLVLSEAPLAPGTTQEFVLMFGQTIPKPFCVGDYPFIRVDGPVRLRQTVQVSGSGGLTSQTFADGELSVRNVLGGGGELGPAQAASVRDHYHTLVHDRNWSVASSRQQSMATASGTTERLHQRLHVQTSGTNRYRSEEHCGS